MPYKRKFIGALDVMVDESTGAILTNVGDVQAIVSGITGGKTLKDIDDTLDTPAQESGGNLEALKDIAASVLAPAVAATSAWQFLENPIDGDTCSIGELTFEFDTGVKATGSIALTDGQDPVNPTDGETITIGDGENTFVFEFDDDQELSNPEHVGVTIGQDAIETMAALIIAIVESDLLIAVTPGDPPDHTCELVHMTAGEAGNVEILTTGAAIVVTGMAGGVNPGDDVGELNIGVAIGEDLTETRDNLVAAITGSEATVTAAAVGDDGILLTWAVAGTVGNGQTCDESTQEARMTVEDFHGGLDAVSLRNFGGKPEASEPGKTVSVLDENTEVLAANPARTYALFVNESNAGIRLSLGGDPDDGGPLLVASPGNGAPGGYWEMNFVPPYTGAINAKAASAGGKNLTVVEV